MSDRAAANGADASWEAFLTAQVGGALLVQRCGDCRRFLHPPAPICYECESRRLSFEPVRGSGRLLSWTWVHADPPAHASEAMPYLVVQVELDDQPGLQMTVGLSSLDVSTRLRRDLQVHHDKDAGPLPLFALQEDA